MSLQMVTAGKAALQSRLEALSQTNQPQADLGTLQTVLDQQLKLLGALEDTFHKRNAYRSQLANLPQQLDTLRATGKALETQKPHRFPKITEQLRDQYETQLQNAQSEIEAVIKRNATGELRLAGIAKELEHLPADRIKVENELLSARGETAQGAAPPILLQARVELLELNLHYLRAQVEALAVEREWLTKRGPLQDLRLKVAKLRLDRTQQTLEAIKQALSHTLKREQAALKDTAEGIERKLERVADPAETMRLSIGLETVEIRKLTAQYRDQLNRFSDRVLAQEKRNSQEKQDLDRLASLVEKYTSGEHVAQRLQRTFERLQRERASPRDEETHALEEQRQGLTVQMFDLEDRLYEFDRLAEGRLTEWVETLDTQPSQRKQAMITQVRHGLDEQKTALREQQQALAALVQDLTKLIALHREHDQLLDDTYRFILTKLFWLQDGEPLNWVVVQNAVAGAGLIGKRLQLFAHSELTRLHAKLGQSLRLGVLLALTFLLLPLGAYWIWRRLSPPRRDVRVHPRPHLSLSHLFAAAVRVALQSIVWPIYLAIAGWTWSQLLSAEVGQSELEAALHASLRLGVLLLWLACLGHLLFRRDGWGPQYAGIPRDVCRRLDQTLGVGWLAALLLLIPRHVLLTIPETGPHLQENMALARLCLTAFQVVVGVLVSLSCHRGSLIIRAILADSRQRHGVLWRHWPLIYVTLLAGMGMVIALDAQGYCYAARALWMRSAEAFLVILGLMAAYHTINVVLHRLTRQRMQAEGQAGASAPATPEGRLQLERQFMRFMLALIGFLALQHLYGLDHDLLSALDAIELVEVGKGEGGEPLWLTLGNVLTPLLILMGAGLLVRNLPGLYEVVLFPRMQWDAGFRYAFLTLSRYLLVVIALWSSLALLHLRWSSIQWVIAAASVGLGFGLQELVSNFISGLILLIERPISVGDFVAVGGQEGTVTHITIRATTVQNLDNQTVLIPNKAFIAEQVMNWTLGETCVRVTLPIGVAYGSDMALVKQLLTAVVACHPNVLKSPPPQVLFRAFGESSLDWEVWFFVPTPQERFAMTHDILFQIEQAFRQHGVVVPFPQRDLHLRSADAAVVMQTPAAEGLSTAPPSRDVAVMTKDEVFR